MAYLHAGEAEGRFKSRANNPFDSSEDEEEETNAAAAQMKKKTSIFPASQNSNPFDDEEDEVLHPRVRNPNPNSYSNPFDDLEEDVVPTKKLPTQSANSNLESITNPFDDEDEYGPSPSSLQSNKSPFHVAEADSKHKSAKSPRSGSSRMIKDRAWSISQKAKASILSANLKFKQREASLQQLADPPPDDDVRFPPRFENKSASRTQEIVSYGAPRSQHTGKQSKDLFDIEDPAEYAASAPPVEDYVNHAVQDLENHALDKSRDTTSAIKNLVKVAEETRGVAGSTLETLHDQGAQIQRTHERTVHLDQHLERGEKLLNSLGGIFSKSWKPKKTRKITGPVIGRGDSFKRRGTPADRAALGLTEGQCYGEEKRSNPGGSSVMQGSTDFQSQVVRERKIQDDALSDLSNVIGQLKEMSVDMHAEIARQNEGLEHLSEDANELNSRIQQSNVRARRVLRRR